RARGLDPREKRNAERVEAKVAAAKAMTFDECRKAFVAAHKAGWRTSADQYDSSLRRYCSEPIGSLAVSTIDVTHVMKILEPIWLRTPEIARRLRARIEAVLDWAKARGYRDGENPARWKGHLDKLLLSPAKIRKAVRPVRHHESLPYAE